MRMCMSYIIKSETTEISMDITLSCKYDEAVSQEVTVTAYVHEKYPMEYVYSTIQGLLSTCMMYNNV